MDIRSQLLFFFSALGAFNGIILGLFFLFYVRPKHRSHLFLGLLLLALSVRVGKSVFYYFNYDLADVYIQVGLFACWFIGPLLYFYVKTVLEVTRSASKDMKRQFAVLMLLALVLFLGFPRNDHEGLWTSWLIRLIYLQWVLYVIAAGYYVRKNYPKVQSIKKGMPSFKLWFLSIYIGNAIICIAFNTGNYTSYIVGALSFSFVFYLLALLLLFAKKRNELIFLNVPRDREKRIPVENANVLTERLEDMMMEGQLHKDPDLTLAKVAKKLGVLPNKLSLLLNDNIGVSFPDYLNKKRVAEAKAMIKSNSNYSFEAIGYDCGFNSKSAFYAAFKKHAGTTPSKYRASSHGV